MPKSVSGLTTIPSPIAENWGQWQSVCTGCFDFEEATSDASWTTFANRDPKLLSIFNLSVHLEVPLISSYKEHRGLEFQLCCRFFSGRCRKRKGQSASAVFYLEPLHTTLKGIVLLAVSYRTTACRYQPLQPVLRRALKANTLRDSPSLLLKLILYDFRVVFEQHKAASWGICTRTACPNRDWELLRDGSY